jgi:hypothetical protein
MRNLHLLKQTFSQARQASGTHQSNGAWTPLTLQLIKANTDKVTVKSYRLVITYEDRTLTCSRSDHRLPGEE